MKIARLFDFINQLILDSRHCRLFEEKKTFSADFQSQRILELIDFHVFFCFTYYWRVSELRLNRADTQIQVCHQIGMLELILCWPCNREISACPLFAEELFFHHLILFYFQFSIIFSYRSDLMTKTIQVVNTSFARF